MKAEKQFVEKLNKAMIEDFVAVNKKRNPIAKNLAKDMKALQYVIGQYSIFPKNIVSFLEFAKNKAKEMNWKNVEEEIIRNMGEELGSKSNGITHYDLLVNGVKEELGLDISNIQISESTKNFIESMKSILSNKNPYYIMGATYALEDSAVPELALVVEWVSHLFIEITGKPIQDKTLKFFFDMHLGVWEPGHEEGLRNTVFEKISSEEDRDNFEAGFREVLKTMDFWWNGLYNEASQN
ncbi:DUF3865 domain-containing protein [Candidatus Woesearchaeota archaeon]|nr:DUF3865 domain-containing protein [Candidatus Woesearchaeota archaeon]